MLGDEITRKAGSGLGSSLSGYQFERDNCQFHEGSSLVAKIYFLPEYLVECRVFFTAVFPFLHAFRTPLQGVATSLRAVVISLHGVAVLLPALRTFLNQHFILLPALFCWMRPIFVLRHGFFSSLRTVHIPLQSSFTGGNVAWQWLLENHKTTGPGAACAAGAGLRPASAIFRMLSERKVECYLRAKSAE